MDSMGKIERWFYGGICVILCLFVILVVSIGWLGSPWKLGLFIFLVFLALGVTFWWTRVIPTKSRNG